MNEIEYIKAVRAKIEQGWTQGAWGRDASGTMLTPSELHTADKVCLRGAIEAVWETLKSTNDGVLFETTLAVTETIRKQIINSNLGPNDKTGVITYYNDHPDRTKQDVLNLLDTVITSLENNQ